MNYRTRIAIAAIMALSAVLSCLHGGALTNPAGPVDLNSHVSWPSIGVYASSQEVNSNAMPGYVGPVSVEIKLGAYTTSATSEGKYMQSGYIVASASIVFTKVSKTNGKWLAEKVTVTRTNDLGSSVSEYSNVEIANPLTFDYPGSTSGVDGITFNGMFDSVYSDDEERIRQQDVTIYPATATVVQGTELAFTADGGSGTGAFVWGGSASGNGVNKGVRFDAVGQATVSVYRAASTGYDQSNTATATIQVTAANTPPFGSFDGADPVVNQGTNVNAGGWAADNEQGAPVARVEMRLDGTFVGNATLGISRADVAAAFSRPDYASSGWSWSQGTSSLGAGAYTLSARVVDNQGAAVDLADRTFTVVTWGWQYWWTGWYPTSGWTPDPATVFSGQTFTQTRNIRRDQYGREVSSQGGVRNDNTYITSQNDVESQTATGTMNRPPTVSASTADINALGSASVTWNAGDPDGNLNRVEIYVVRGAGTRDLVGSFNQAAGSTSWASSSNYSSANAGSDYQFIARAVDSLGVAVETSAAFVVRSLAQSLAISPASATVVAGQSATFTASGGHTSYVWGGAASGSGTSQTITFPNVGSYGVQVQAPASNTYAASATATASVSVTQASQTISLSPGNQTVIAGQSITFTAAGGNNGYVWGGSAGASGGGNTKSVSFPTPGVYTVTCYSPNAGNYLQSNTVTVTITVNWPAPTATISVTPLTGVEPVTATVTWSSTNATSVTVGGTNLSSATASGTSTVTLAAGSHSFTITASNPGGSASNASPAVVVDVANPILAVSALTSADFGSVYRDTQAGTPISATRQFRVSNVGNAPLSVTGISVTGHFALTTGIALPTTIPAGGSVQIVVTFGPGVSVGANTGVLSVVATSNTVAVPLTGTGLAPVLGVTWR